ncbi:MAG: glycosyltransferase family 39 protein [Planctomycetaceae bacterium]|jgi:hypothetical protein|nr:glycosyltransferase family 39 protein [Planctomycetaceae bacterium]
MMKSFRPALIFWFFAISYCLIWAILCVVFQRNFRSDILPQYFLGDQWVLGCGIHPMISAWYLNLIRFLTFDSEIAPYLTTESCVLIMLWCIWQLAREYLKDEKLALLAVLAAANFRYLNIGNLVYNHNTALTVCWVPAILCLYWALTQNRLRMWILTGFWLGLGFHGKYTIALLVFTMLVFMFIDPQARKYWKTPRPYITILVAIFIFLPHLIWLFNHDFFPIFYALNKIKQQLIWYQRLIIPAKFFFGLILVLIPSALTLVPITGWIWQLKFRHDLGMLPEDRFRLAFLGTMIGIPIALHLVAGLLGTAQMNSYVMALGMYVPVLFIYVLKIRLDSKSFYRTAILGLLIAVGTMTIWAGALTYSAQFGKKPAVSQFPGKKLAETVERLWIERYAPTPCPFVTEVNRYWLSGNVNVYGKLHIPVHLENFTLRSSNQEMNQRGGMILWDRNNFPEIDFSAIQQTYPRAEQLPSLEIPYEKPFSPKFLPERIGVAVIPPSPEP